MSKNNVVELSNPETNPDPLTDMQEPVCNNNSCQGRGPLYYCQIELGKN